MGRPRKFDYEIKDAIERITNQYQDSDGGRDRYAVGINVGLTKALNVLKDMPSAEPERLTDDDFETIRIHLNACKEKLCNQRRWKEADEYQRIIDRFMSFASAQPKQCQNCDLFNSNWRCNFWHRFTIPEGFCHNYKEKEEEEENDQFES